MNILIVSSYFYPDGGGAENYIYNIAKRLVENENKVTVLCSSHGKEEIKETIHGIKIIRLKPDFNISTAPLKLGLFSNIIKLIKNNDFDLMSINFYLPYYPDIAALVGRMYHIPSVLTWYNESLKSGFLMNSITQFYNYSLNRVTLNLVDLIVTASPYGYLESKSLERFRDKLECIPPGVDIYRYTVGKSFKIPEKHKIPNSSKIVLYVGSLSKANVHKGVDYLIRSFKIVLDEFNEVYLVLVGKGDMIGEYENLCKTLGIEKNVIFTGFVDEDRLIEYYKSSDMVVLPSTTSQEGFGMVLIEGNACGKPVIGSEIGGIQYVIKDGKTGLLVPPKNPEKLAKAILKLLKDEKLAGIMGDNGRKYVEENYSWNKIAKITERVYRGLI